MLKLECPSEGDFCHFIACPGQSLHFLPIQRRFDVRTGDLVRSCTDGQGEHHDCGCLFTKPVQYRAAGDVHGDSNAGFWSRRAYRNCDVFGWHDFSRDAHARRHGKSDAPNFCFDGGKSQHQRSLRRRRELQWKHVEYCYAGCEHSVEDGYFYCTHFFTESFYDGTASDIHGDSDAGFGHDLAYRDSHVLRWRDNAWSAGPRWDR
nr:hypothetical protein [uncultured bacterium]